MSIYDALITWPHFHVFHCSHKNAELIQESQSLAAAFFSPKHPWVDDLSTQENLARNLNHISAYICHHLPTHRAFTRSVSPFWEVECHTSSSCNSSILSQRSLRSFHYAQTRSLISLCHCAAVIFSSFLSRWKFKSLSKECPIPLGGDQIQRLMQRKPRWFCLQPMTCHSHVAVMLPHLKSTPHLRRFARRFKHDLRSGWWFYITIWKNDGVRQWVSDDIPYIIPYIMEPYTILIMMENHPFMFHSAPTFVISSDATRNATRNALRPILPKSLDAKM